MPALLTSTSMPPHAATSAATVALTCAASATEPWNTSGSQPRAARLARAASASFGSVLNVNATRAPCDANASRDRAAEPARAAGDEAALAVEPRRALIAAPAATNARWPPAALCPSAPARR